MSIYSDLCNFAIGSRVDILDIPEFQGVEITRIADSGVTIKGPRCPNETVVSSKSPAKHTQKKIIPMNVIKTKTDGSAEIIAPTTNTNTQESSNTSKSRAPRGSLTEKMKNIKVPDGLFTVKQIAELNDIPVPYANSWVKDNCSVEGEAPKEQGQRGKAAKLYKQV